MLDVYARFMFPAMDLSKAIKVFFRRHKNFRKTPAYLFGQSYGGKACPRLGFYLHTVRIGSNNY